MSSAIVNKHHTAFKRCLTKIGKSKMKKDKHVKRMISDFKHHFKVDKWALGYEVNRDSLCPYEFNVLLELLKYELCYSSKSASIVFRPRGVK